MSEFSGKLKKGGLEGAGQMECYNCGSENLTYEETVDGYDVYLCEDCGERTQIESEVKV